MTNSIKVGAVAIVRCPITVSPGVSSHLIDETVTDSESVGQNGSTHTRESALLQRRRIVASKEEEQTCRKLGQELRRILKSRPFFFQEGTRYVLRADIPQAKEILADVRARISAYNATAEYTSINLRRAGIIDLDVDTQAHIADLQQEIGSRLEALQLSVDAHSGVLSELLSVGMVDGGIEAWNERHDSSRTILRGALNKVAETEVMLADDESRRALGTILGGVRKRLKMARGLATAPAEAQVDVVGALNKRKGAIMEFADVSRPPVTNASQALDEAERLKAELESALTSMGRLAELCSTEELVARIEAKAAEVEAKFAELTKLADTPASAEQVAAIRQYAARTAERRLASYQPSQDAPKATAETIEPTPVPSAPSGAVEQTVVGSKMMEMD